MRKDGQFDKCTVRLVIQGQHMHRKHDTGVCDFEDAFSPVPYASIVRTILSLAYALRSRGYEIRYSVKPLLPGDCYDGKVYISPPIGFTEDNGHVTRLSAPSCSLWPAQRCSPLACHHKRLSQNQGCALVGFERSMWCVTISCHTILIAAQIDDFILACADRATLDTFCQGLWACFDGTLLLRG